MSAFAVAKMRTDIAAELEAEAEKEAVAAKANILRLQAEAVAARVMELKKAL